VKPERVGHLRNNPRKVLSATLRHWFRPSGIVGTAGGEVVRWEDSGPKENALTPVGARAAGKIPLIKNNVLNGATVLDSTTLGTACEAMEFYNGKAIELANSRALTLFCVVKWTGLNSGHVNCAMATKSTGQNAVRLELADSGHFQVTYENVVALPANESPSLNTWHYVVVKINGTDAPKAWIDGVALTGFASGNTPGPSNTRGFQVIGNGAASADPFKGMIAEGAFFDGLVDASDRVQYLERYARRTYGL
jgi:hypothetical protein